MQALTLEMILRAVFGLDPGERLEEVRKALGELLAFGEQPLTPVRPGLPIGSRRCSTAPAR